MIRLKPGVKLTDLAPQVVLAIAAAESIWFKHGQTTLVVTSCNDGSHKPTSLHYRGRAVDLRSKALPEFARQEAVQELREALGVEFDVLHEGIGSATEHVHCEYDPKQGGTA